MAFDALAFQRSLPRKRMGAGAVIRDDRGRVLLVEPTYKDVWEVPGGCVEEDESPRTACVREIGEELGLRMDVGRLLCFEWQGPEPHRTESLMFLYDGGVLSPDAPIVLPPDELRSWAFVDPARLDERLLPRLARRIRAALDALEDGTLAELEHGERVS